MSDLYLVVLFVHYVRVSTVHERELLKPGPPKQVVQQIRHRTQNTENHHTVDDGPNQASECTQ
jgi:hypothetical protein